MTTDDLAAVDAIAPRVPVSGAGGGLVSYGDDARLMRLHLG